MSTDPAIGDVLLDRYELIEEIGRGGFGVVFRAKQLGMNRDVAVKLLHSRGDQEMRERFKREAMMARNLNHPHTIRQYDFGETPEGTLYLVLEYLDGVNLVEAIRSEGALSDARVKQIAEGVLKSLGEAHSQGIVHRDLKPANIMICNIFGEEDFPKVLDFGIAKTVHGNTDLTQAGVALGSPKYMAPEVLQGKQPTPAADVYSIAITFAEAIMGKALLETSNSVEAAQAQLSPEPLPIPPELQQSELYPWLSIALKKDVAERYEDAAEMLDYLHAPVPDLAERGATVASAGAIADDEAPTMRFDPSANGGVDPFLQTMEGMESLDSSPESMETLPEDGIDASAFTGPDQFAKTEALESISGDAGPEATHDPLAVGGYDDDDAPTEMISAADFESAFGTAPTNETQPSVDATIGNDPSLATAEMASPSFDSNAATERHEAVVGNADLTSGGPANTAFGTGAGGGASSPNLGPMPGIGQGAPAGGTDADRTEFVDIHSLQGPAVSTEEKKSQRTLFIALGGIVFVGLTALAGLAAFLFYISSSSDAPAPPKPDEPATTATATTAEKVEVRIYAKPKVVSVIIDGQEKTKTPAHFRIRKAELPKKIELRHPGYTSQTIEVTAEGKNVFDIKLESAVKLKDEKKGDDAKKADEPAASEEKATTKKKKRRRRKPKPKPKVEVEVWD